MKNKIIVEIDFNKITKDLLEKETYIDGSTVYNSIQESAKREIKNWIQSSVVSDIKQAINLNDFKERGYSGEWLKEEAKKILIEELRELVAKYTKEWISQNMKWIVEKEAQKNIEEFIVPRLQKLIGSLIVVNTENVEQEMEEMRDDYQNQIRELEENLPI
jgi:predicted MPP superfamily phosphohydrolase